MSRSSTSTILFEQSLDSIPESNSDLYNWARSIYSPTVKIVEENCSTAIGKKLPIALDLLGKKTAVGESRILLDELIRISDSGIKNVGIRDISTCVSNGGICLHCLRESRPGMFSWSMTDLGNPETNTYKADVIFRFGDSLLANSSDGDDPYRSGPEIKNLGSARNFRGDISGSCIWGDYDWMFPDGGAPTEVRNFRGGLVVNSVYPPVSEYPYEWGSTNEVLFDTKVASSGYSSVATDFERLLWPSSEFSFGVMLITDVYEFLSDESLKIRAGSGLTWAEVTTQETSSTVSFKIASATGETEVASTSVPHKTLVHLAISLKSGVVNFHVNGALVGSVSASSVNDSLISGEVTDSPFKLYIHGYTRDQYKRAVQVLELDMTLGYSNYTSQDFVKPYSPALSQWKAASREFIFNAEESGVSDLGNYPWNETQPVLVQSEYPFLHRAFSVS